LFPLLQARPEPTTEDLSAGVEKSGWWQG